MSSKVWIDTSPAAHLYIALAHVTTSVVSRRLSSQGQQRRRIKREEEKRGGKELKERKAGILIKRYARLCYQFGISPPKLLSGSNWGRLPLILLFVVQQSIHVSHNGYSLLQFLFFLSYQTWNHSVIRVLFCTRLRALHGETDCLSIAEPSRRSSLGYQPHGNWDTLSLPFNYIEMNVRNINPLMGGNHCFCQEWTVNTRLLPFCLLWIKHCLRPCAETNILKVSSRTSAIFLLSEFSQLTVQCHARAFFFYHKCCICKPPAPLPLSPRTRYPPAGWQQLLEHPGSYFLHLFSLALRLFNIHLHRKKFIKNGNVTLSFLRVIL